MTAMCGGQLQDRKKVKELMQLLKETIDQLIMVNNVCLYGHVLSILDGHVLRALEFEIDKQRMSGSSQGDIEESGRGGNARMPA